MAENYCGKDCTQCNCKDALACPGCKTGPGRTFGGDCVTAKCCQERGHETCATCSQNDWCSKRGRLEERPADRLQKQKWEQEKRQRLEKQVPTLAKYLPLIFWLVIVGAVPDFLSNTFTVNRPTLYLTGEILSLILNFAIIVLYFCLGKVNSLYTKSAIFAAVFVAIDFTVIQIAGSDESAWLLLIRIPLAVIGFVGEYYKYVAHSTVLVSVDYDLSEKWMQLWKWRIRCLVVILIGLVLMALLALLGALVIFAAGTGILVITIKELIYLYRMGDLFRAYARQLKD